MDLLRVGELRLEAVDRDDPALSSTVRWAHSTELPDPTAYLRGGELVCTVGASLTDPERCERFADSLSDAGAVGVCFGVGDIHNDVPTALVEACRARRLPLLLAPLGAPFSAISEYLAGRRVEAEILTNRSAELLMPTLLSGLRTHEPVSALLGIAVEVMGGRLELALDGLVVETAQGSFDDVAGPDLTAPVLGRGELRWWGNEAAPQPRLLAQLSRFVEVALSERDLEAALRRERVGQLLDLVQEGLANPAALSQALAGGGLDRESLVASAWPQGSGERLAARLPRALVGAAPGVTWVVTASHDDLPSTAEALALPCGYGPTGSMTQLGAGLSEAHAALDLARSKGGAIGPAGLTSLEALLAQQPPGRLDPFVRELIDPLVRSDVHRGTEHVATLRAFLDHDGSLERTARAQFLHVNTVRHRLGRVHQITGRDPLVFTDRVSLAIALWAYDGPAPWIGPVVDRRVRRNG